MRPYEIMVILDPTLDERTVAPSLETFLNVIRKDGGSVDKVDIWGKRRLAYEIAKHAEGIYAVIDVKAAPATVSELDRQLSLNEVGAADQGSADRQALVRTACARRRAYVGSPATDFAHTAKSQEELVAGDTIITVVGNLTADPELRFTPSGAAVANFTVASTPRIFDRQSNEWKDGDALFMRCSIWREAAENVAESLTRGSRVIVQGRLKQRSYETREGEKRTVVELEVDEIGPSLRYATAKVNKASRSGGGGGGFGSGGGGGGGSRGGGGGDSAEAKTDDPWGSAPASGSFSGGDDEPPF